MSGTEQHPPRDHAKSPGLKMREYRARLRKAGLRPLQIWVPDTRSARFAEEARRQSLLVSGTPGDKEALDFIEASMDWWDDEAW